MSFADDLRKVEKYKDKWSRRADQCTDEVCGAIERECNWEAYLGNNSIKGYIKFDGSQEEEIYSFTFTTNVEKAYDFENGILIVYKEVVEDHIKKLGFTDYVLRYEYIPIIEYKNEKTGFFEYSRVAYEAGKKKVMYIEIHW